MSEKDGLYLHASAYPHAERALVRMMSPDTLVTDSVPAYGHCWTMTSAWGPHVSSSLGSVLLRVARS